MRMTRDPYDESTDDKIYRKFATEKVAHFVGLVVNNRISNKIVLEIP